jgi:hypothetical protein
MNGGRACFKLIFFQWAWSIFTNILFLSFYLFIKNLKKININYYMNYFFKNLILFVKK